MAPTSKWFTFAITVAFLIHKDACVASDSKDVEYYEKLITEELEKALTYELPTDAKNYKPDNTTTQDFGTFDFIIIGAGSTGSVIANRLSEISKWKVLLLEAGYYPNNFTLIPAMFAIQAMTSYNWGFKSTPQTTACLGTADKRCVVHRGKGVGGTSLIHQNIYSRGNSIDYDNWASMLNDSSWRYENVLEYFKKSEDFHRNNPDAPVDWQYHGKKGYLYTNFHLPPSNLTEIFLQANRELGKNITDYNGKEELGATILQLNIKKGMRYDQASAFVKPVSCRNNLEVSVGSYVIKIEIDETKRARSVLFTKNKTLYRVHATKEIILSAGTISSPQLLMLSGIGPKNHLAALKIPIVEDLPTGNNLRDHIFCGVQFSTNVSTHTETLTRQIEEYLKGYGDLSAGNPHDAAGWYKTKFEKTANYPDLEILPAAASPAVFAKIFLNWSNETWNTLFNISAPNILTLTSVLLHVKSSGSVRLRSNDPFAYPDIDFNALNDTDDTDIKTLYEGIQTVLNISRTAAFRRIGAKLEVRPLPACSQHRFLSDDFWYCFIRQTAIPAFHPVGTCATGAVVDGNLTVFGVRGLMVADASVLPFTFSGHPHAICTMIGEKVSDGIKNKYITDIMTNAP